MHKMFNFQPFPGLSNPHLQTIFGAMANWNRNPLSEREFVTLPDGDKLSIVITTPQHWKPHDTTVIMIHGLCGSHSSPYLVRMTNKLESDNIRSVRVNLRGSGYGQGLATKTYHGGISDDLYHVLKKIKETTPDSPITIIGFSLSGNILLKLAGEMGSEFHHYVEKIIAVCPSIDLEDSAYQLQKKENKLYHRSFLDRIVKSVEKRENPYAYTPETSLSSCKSLIDFDNLFTAPAWGFRDALDYYRKCSSRALIPEIAVRCHLLFADDDPIINSELIKPLVLPSHIDLLITENGGHMGYLGHPKNGDFYWMDTLLLHWIQN